MCLGCRLKFAVIYLWKYAQDTEWLPCTFVEDLKKYVLSSDLKINYQMRIAKVGIVAHICNLIKWEAEAGDLLQV